MGSPQRSTHARHVGPDGIEALLAEGELPRDGHEIHAQAQQDVHAHDREDRDVVVHGTLGRRPAHETGGAQDEKGEEEQVGENVPVADAKEP